MLFNSIAFLVFFPIVATAYFVAPHRWRWALLLVASYVFYMWWRAEYAILILASTSVDYAAGLALGRARSRGVRRSLLVASLVANLGLLVSFKYLDFLGEVLRSACGLAGVRLDVPTLDVLLPVGISFYTFQSLSYTIDVFRGRAEPERHFGRFALYVSFFPQLVAGPIERATSLLPQLAERHRFEYDRVADGLRLMAWGFFKKVVIADRVAAYVDAVYLDPGTYGGTEQALATYFFAFQIYCDFSGYSDIAIGAAQVLGVRLMTNFRRPYFATSVGDFWRRWHVSLSTWFRDYLYLPLGGSRVSPLAWVRNVAVVFLLSGLWHGASWTFLVWGALHACYYLLERLLRGPGRRLSSALGLGRAPAFARLLRTAATFHLVLVAWIFFRASSVGDALAVLRGIASGVDPTDLGRFESLRPHVLVSLGLIAFLVAAEVVQSRASAGELVRRLPSPVRWLAYYALLVTMVLFGAYRAQEFIYFQF